MITNDLKSQKRSVIFKLIKKLIWFAPIFLTMVVVNLWVDPAGLFRSEDYEMKIAKNLADGMNVTDYRVLKLPQLVKYYINFLNSAPDLIILGSSRSMGISSDVFPGSHLVNSSISSACLEDIIGAYGLFEKKGLRPKRIIIGVDQLLLSIKGEKKGIEEPLKDGYEYIKRNLSRMNGSWDVRPSTFFDLKYLEIFSPRYFRSSLKEIKRRGNLLFINNGEDQFKVATQKYNQTSTRLSDMSRMYSIAEIEKPTEQLVIESNKEGCSAGYFVNFDKEKTQLFKSFIQMLKNNGVEVVLFLTPYSPIKRKCQKNESYRVFELADEYYRKLGEELGVPVLGSYLNYGDLFVAEDFVDSSHLWNFNGLRKLFYERVLRQEANK